MTRRLSINLPDKEADDLAGMIETTGQTATAVITKAILDEDFLREEERAGTIILLEDTDGNRRQVVFR